MTVIVRLRGGLGNQMFQYAAGIAQAERSGRRLMVDSSRMFTEKIRSYSLGAFNAPQANLGKLLCCLMEAAVILDRKRKRNGKPPLLGRWLFTENGHDINPDFFADARGSVYILDGFFQSERYFDDHAPAVRKALRFPATDNAIMRDWEQKIGACEAVAIHIRRGDYVQPANAAASLQALGLDYYARAVAEIRTRVSAPHFFVFSDDLDWARQNVNIPGAPVSFIDGWDKLDFHDMQLMSQCRHAIIANSSYSWWSAWLNAAPDKVVVAPQCWFSGGQYESADIIPAAWLRC
ncbi:alpha-1,2-fucosyltransferase [Paludibacterium yongneupense]|uniref:alpha-1,2-fucosyltransferase n=1 Tax=Paludibacterium yongneupense TaxID=400061 RepID=UPI000566B225|nr:alpha-1,2-fucosyltransferase [Paludibacterium yongneupense]